MASYMLSQPQAASPPPTLMDQAVDLALAVQLDVAENAPPTPPPSPKAAAAKTKTKTTKTKATKKRKKPSPPESKSDSDSSDSDSSDEDEDTTKKEASPKALLKLKAQLKKAKKKAKRQKKKAAAKEEKAALKKAKAEAKALAKPKKKRAPNRWMLHMAKYRLDNAIAIKGMNSIDVTKLAHASYVPAPKCPSCGK